MSPWRRPTSPTTPLLWNCHRKLSTVTWDHVIKVYMFNKELKAGEKKWKNEQRSSGFTFARMYTYWHWNQEYGHNTDTIKRKREVKKCLTIFGLHICQYVSHSPVRIHMTLKDRNTDTTLTQSNGKKWRNARRYSAVTFGSMCTYWHWKTEYWHDTNIMKRRKKWRHAQRYSAITFANEMFFKLTASCLRVALRLKCVCVPGDAHVKL